MPDELHIEVVFALPDRQELRTVTLPSGSTVADAIESCAIAEVFPDWNLADCATGIWGRLVPRDHALEQGDRVELYRPLKRDPREARRALAAKGQSMGGEGERS